MFGTHRAGPPALLPAQEHGGLKASGVTFNIKAAVLLRKQECCLALTALDRYRSCLRRRAVDLTSGSSTLSGVADKTVASARFGTIQRDVGGAV